MTLLGLIGSLAVAAFVVAVLDGASLPAASPARAGLLVALTAGGAALARGIPATAPRRLPSCARTC